MSAAEISNALIFFSKRDVCSAAIRWDDIDELLLLCQSA